MPTKPEFWTVPFEGDHLTPYMEAAGQLLSTSFGHSATVIPSEMFGYRWGPKRNVVRCRVDSTTPDAPQMIILRQTRDPIEYNPSEIRTWGPTYQVFDY
ncbi:MAG: hypothetical protein VX910_00020 [Candidatus Latescibacterota bacterium]|nr:hypothetical protein [Candidatus Latescibacterota bacterium]